MLIIQYLFYQLFNTPKHQEKTLLQQRYNQSVTGHNQLIKKKAASTRCARYTRLAWGPALKDDITHFNIHVHVEEYTNWLNARKRCLASIFESLTAYIFIYFKCVLHTTSNLTSYSTQYCLLMVIRAVLVEFHQSNIRSLLFYSIKSANI